MVKEEIISIMRNFKDAYNKKDIEEIHILEGSYEGMKYQILALGICEFKGDKIQHVRTVYDRLSLAKQLAKGQIAKTAVNSIINRMEKGLHV
jgi:hypothetical protein